MEAGRARGYRDDNPRLPTLSLGLSSVRLIVNQIEAEYARVVATKQPENNRELVKYDPNIDEGYDDYDDFPLEQPSGRVWNRFVVNLGLALSRCIPSVSIGNFGLLAVATGLFAPRMISYLLVYPFCRLVFGTLYPAYASYKAVRTKNLKEYVKWMMYWIVFALFTCTETFTDVFLSWFPFYYEVKIVLVLWLLSPATKGSSILYRKFVHPALCRREQEIDEYIAKAKDQGYHTVLNLGTKGVNYATTVIMQTAIKGGGGLVQQLRKSYSLSDLTECEPREERGSDEADDVMTEPRLIKRGGKSGFSTRRSASESNSRSPIYFPEVDVDVRSTRSSRSDEPDFSHIKSTEDISSGYSSADNSGALSRTSSLGARGRAARTPARLTAIKRPPAAEDSEVIIEEPHDDDTFEYANMPPLFNIPSPLFLSHSDPPFLYQYIGDEIKIVQVLGDLPLSNNNNETNSSAQHHEKNKIIDNSLNKIDKEKEDTTFPNVIPNSFTNTDAQVAEASVDIEYKDKKPQDSSEFGPSSFTIPEISEAKPVETDNDVSKDGCKIDVLTEPTSIDTSNNDNDSAESDDEASFGTPENSPKTKRKSPRGKYGKAKAPPPPNVLLPDDDKELSDKMLECAISTTSQESLTDIVNKLPNNVFKETASFKGLQIINPIAEKRRHKSKSPGRIPKVPSSGIGKLLQLPSKLAFWQKPDEKPKSDNISNSSGDCSRRSSSTIERPIDEFQSCSELDKIASTTDDSDLVYMENNSDNISFKDVANDFDSEIISQDIIEKSDALQKLINAKIESHPEYKFVPLHEEIPTTSKSTDV
ncbi:LOW QUALITY PROTEIN: uncharacterized protein ACR2FA_000849 [Aphomia sociella]